MFIRSILVLTIGLLASHAAADEPAPLANQPIAILRSGGFYTKAAEDYFRKLRDDLGVGNKLASQMEQQQTKAVVSKLDGPASGMLVYLGSGLLPSIEQVQFAEVADQEEFVRLVNARSAAAGELSKLKGSGDLYSMAVTTTWRVKVDKIQPVSNTEVVEEPSSGSHSPEDAANGVDEASPAASGSVTISVGASSGTGVVVRSGISDGEGKLIEENGEMFREYSSSHTSYFRYHDGFLFESQAEALHTMNLPSGDSLRQMDNADVGGEMVFHPDRIPMGLRMLGWNALSTAMGAELQQQDDEPDAEYALRRSFGDAGLALVRSAMIDTEKVSAWVKMPFDDNPVQGEFRVSSRKNSDLGRTLREIASAESRFAPILNDDSAVTLHFAVKLPDAWKEVFAALRTAIDEAPSMSSEPEPLRAAYLEVSKCIGAIAEHGNLEMFAKIGWTKESGGVFFLGLQSHDNPALLPSIQLLCDTPGESEALSGSVAPSEIVQLRDLQMLKMASSDEEDDEPAFMYCANVDSCLWFAAGGENAHEIIHQSVDRCREAGGRIATPVLTATVDLQRWAEYPHDDSSEIANMHDGWHWITYAVVSVLMEEIMGWPEAGEDLAIEQNSIFSDAVALGGSKSMSFTINTDESGLVARGTVGDAMARGYMAIAIGSLEELVAPTAEDSDAEPATDPSE